MSDREAERVRGYGRRFIPPRMPNNLIKLWEVSEMFGTVIDFALWNSEENRRMYAWQELVQHEYAIGTEAFNAEICKYVHDNWDSWGLGWEGAYDKIRWSIPPVNQGHYVSPPAHEEEESAGETTLGDMMHDYALWVGHSITSDESGAEYSANQLSPIQYIEECLIASHVPPKIVVFQFLGQFYNPYEVRACMDRLKVWE